MRGAELLYAALLLAAHRVVAGAAAGDAGADAGADAPAALAGVPDASAYSAAQCEAEGAGFPCVAKCCPKGSVLMEEDKSCHPSDVDLEVIFENATEPASAGSYVLAYGDPCSNGKYLLDPEVEEDYYLLLADGSLSVPGTQTSPFESNQYCMESLLDADGNVTTLTFLCFPVSKAEQGSTLHRIFYPLGLLLSVPFLLATVCVYSAVRELRDLHGRALCCYAACMAVAYLSLAIVQLGGQSFGQKACTTFAYIIQFSFVTCFFWLNVMCIDVCWYILAFTGAVVYYPCLPQWQFWENRGWLRVEDENADKEQERVFARKIFYCYSAYAWGIPIILLIIVMILDLNPALPVSYVKPSMGDLVCWFSISNLHVADEQASLHYFYGPIGLILLVNTVLFCITMYRVIKHQWNRKGPHRTPRQRARMCLVLFLAMGLSWVMEIVSWALGGPPYVWAVTDAFNVLQGVVIFIIFVMEPRVRVVVCKKLGKKRTHFSHY